MGELLAVNLAWREQTRFDLLGRPLADLVVQARREVLSGAVSYVADSLRESESRVAEKLAFVGGPFVVTGHQPGLVHPGVWVKNFAAAALAEAHRGVGLHVIIDADVCRSPAILVPSGGVDEPRQAFVEFDGPAAELPWEERSIVDPQLWKSFPERVHQECGELVTHPLLDEWWPTALERGAATGLLGAALAQARHRTEWNWGTSNAELPQSQLCQTGAFRWFSCALLAELPRFVSAYNGALADYRRDHHLRNHAQPVPDLAADGGWLEAPFWIWTTADRRRRAVFVRPATSGLIISDRRGFERLLPLSAGAGPEDAMRAVASLGEWEAEGVKLRSRALVTTMFIRLVVADLFLHGIGGAKYDEATDAICRRFFGAAPPAFATLSGTLRLPINHAIGDAGEGRRLQTELRELTFHPERKLAFSAAANGERTRAAAIAAEKMRWIGSPKQRDNAFERHQAIAAANVALQPFLAAERANLEQQLGAALERGRASRVLDSREYAFCLFPRPLLEQFLLDFSPPAL
jgi:hypothetical protein